jgi:hypothetical protein
MIYFVELRLFGSKDQDTLAQIRQEMQRSLHDMDSWLEWHRNINSGVAHRPDVLLINASDLLDENALDILLRRTEARAVVLFGAQRAALALPSLQHAGELTTLSDYLPENQPKASVDVDSILSIFGLHPQVANAL